jgi:hypothetical protein
MKASHFTAFLALLAAGACVRLMADIPFLWLDAPTSRDNAHDPKSDLYRPSPLFFPSATPRGTATDTPSFSPSPTAPGTFTITPTPSASPSASQTSTATPTPSPSPTASPTPQGPLKLYDGDTVGYRLSDGAYSTSTNFAAGQAGLSESSVGGGAQSSGSYMRLTMTGGAGTSYGEGTYYTSGGPFNVSANYNALSFYVRVPSNGCTTSFRPMMQLLSNGGYPYDHSLPVTVTCYLSGTSALSYDTWTQVIIPLTAFLGSNYEGGTFTAAALSSIAGFQVQAFQGQIYSDGSIPPSEVHIDQVQFVNLSPASLPGLSSHGRVFDDFENQQHTEWNTYRWQVAQDPITCTPQTSFSFPVGGVGNIPIDAGGNSLTACHAAHIQGFVNGNTSCPSSVYPYANMAAYFSPNGAGNYVDLHNNSFVNFSPNVGAHGLIFRMKTSLPNHGQVYLVRLHRHADELANNYDDYQVWVSDSSADPNPVTSTWKAFMATFPAEGSSPPNLNTGSGATQLGFAQQGWGTPESWSSSDLEYITIMPNSIGQTFDLWVDDIEFY